MRKPTQSTEQEILMDLNNVVFAVCEHNSVAAKHYDSLVEEYHRNGEKAAYKMLDNIVQTEQYLNEQSYMGR